MVSKQHAELVFSASLFVFIVLLLFADLYFERLSILQRIGQLSKSIIQRERKRHGTGLRVNDNRLLTIVEKKPDERSQTAEWKCISNVANCLAWLSAAVGFYLLHLSYRS
ncbi:hypothetical protein ONS96_003694 [Cadophora gregata f. sp. sojae]|nr:hypothetical protein ONS96_003694 [Cadophora gregata f. sp. sojae]